MNVETIADLMLLGSASNYDLTIAEERKRSNNDLVELFYIIQKRSSPDASFEIGAFDAGFSVKMRNLVPSAIAYAFEANPYNFEHFCKTKNFDKIGINYEFLAISDRVGSTSFQIQKSLDGKEVGPIRGNNSLLHRTREGVSYEDVVVPCTTLHDFIVSKRLGGKTYGAWIDVEGAVGVVLEGMNGSISSCLSILVEVEQHPYWQGQWLSWDVIGYLMKLGFIPVARDFEFAHQFNLVFVREDLLRISAIRDALAIYHTRSGAQHKVRTV